MHPVAHPLLALDLNASRARAVGGSAYAPPQTLALDAPHEDLPLVLSLERALVEVGRAGAAVCRRWPHLTCHGFLPYLGDKRIWTANRHKLDAAAATRAVVQRLRTVCAEASGLTVTAPAYLDGRQLLILRGLIAEAKLPVLGHGAGAAGPGSGGPRGATLVRRGLRPRHRRSRPDLVGHSRRGRARADS